MMVWDGIIVELVLCIGPKAKRSRQEQRQICRQVQRRSLSGSEMCQTFCVLWSPKKEKELGTLSPTSSDEKSQLEPTGGIASGEGPEPKDMAEKERSGTMSPISSKEDA